ncbi:MAG: efflux RND transporter periplasmic adaptor subunit [bacterium]
MKSRSVVKILLPLGIVVIGIACFQILVRTKPAPPLQPVQAPRPLVQVYRVTTETPRLEVTGYGTVRAKRRITIIPQVTGVVTAKSDNFEPGGYFQSGELLLRIDDTDYRLAIERAAAELARAEYTLALAEEEAVVARREWAGLQSANPAAETTRTEPNPLVLREPQLNLARADLDAARAALAQAEVNLQRCRITAPFAGRVLEASVDEGQYQRAGSTVGTIHASDVAEVTVPLPDADLSWITVPSAVDPNPTQDPHPSGDSTAAQFGSSVDLNVEFAGGKYQWQGNVVRIGGAVDEKSRMVPVVIEIPDPYRQVGVRPPLVEGMFVEARIQGASPAGAVGIPREALRANDTVWVVDDEGVLEIRPVTVARAGVIQAIIAAGLTPGDRVCLSNLQVVSNGMAVRVADGSVARPATASAASGETPTVSGGGDQ